MRGFVGRFHDLAQFKTVHIWHHNVRDNQIRDLFRNKFPCLHSIDSSKHLEIIAENVLHKIQKVVIVLNNQHFHCF